MHGQAIAAASQKILNHQLFLRITKRAIISHTVLVNSL